MGKLSRGWDNNWHQQNIGHGDVSATICSTGSRGDTRCYGLVCLWPPEATDCRLLVTHNIAERSYMHNRVGAHPAQWCQPPSHPGPCPWASRQMPATSRRDQPLHLTAMLDLVAQQLTCPLAQHIEQSCCMGSLETQCEPEAVTSPSSFFHQADAAAICG